MASDGTSAIGLAAQGGHVAALAALLRAGASPNLCVPGMPNAPQTAIIRGHSSCLTILLAAGADPSQVYRHPIGKPLQKSINMRLNSQADVSSTARHMRRAMRLASAYREGSGRWPASAGLPSDGVRSAPAGSTQITCASFLLANKHQALHDTLIR